MLIWFWRVFATDSITGDKKIEISLSEFRKLNSFLSFQNFSNVWNSSSTDINENLLNTFLFDCSANNYTVLHLNCVKFQKNLSQYINEYN